MLFSTTSICYCLLLSAVTICYELSWCYMVLLEIIGYHLAANICHSFPLSTITWYRLLSFDLIYYQLILLSARIYYYLVSCGTLNYYLQLLVLSTVICYYLLNLLLSAIIEYDLLLSIIICCYLLWSITICNFLLLRLALICLCLLLCDTICYYMLLACIMCHCQLSFGYDLLWFAVIYHCMLVSVGSCYHLRLVFCY